MIKYIMYDIRRSVKLMKKIGNFLFEIIVGIWLIVAIFVTVCLLSYNKYGVSTFGNTSLVIIDSDAMEPDFYEGDLLVIKKNSNNKINIGDKVFYYNSAQNSSTWIYYDVVQDKKDVNRDESTFQLGGQNVSSEYIIGKTDGIKVMHNVGTYLGIFTSRWGFMFLIIFPMLFAIIYEIIMIIDARREMKMAAKDE